MSNDGILYKTLKKIHPKTKTPALATMLSGLLAAIMALIFNLHQLIDMMSIGTLLAYTIVAVCVLVLRYQDDGLIVAKEVNIGMPRIVKQLFNLNFTKQPDSLSSSISKIGIVVFSKSGKKNSRKKNFKLISVFINRYFIDHVLCIASETIINWTRKSSVSDSYNCNYCWNGSNCLGYCKAACF